MNKEVIITVGVSGSGKSSWSTQFIKDNPNYLRINRDSIRQTLVGDLDGYYQRQDLNKLELIVNDIESKLFISMLNSSKIPIIDNTNLKLEYVSKWINGVTAWNSESSEFHDYPLILDFKFKLFDIFLEDAKNRVLNRDFEGIEYSSKGDLYLESCLEKVTYIEKQYLQYQEIKKYLETNYKDKII